MALQRVRSWPVRLLGRRPRVPIVSHAASETLSNSLCRKFCLILAAPHYHLHWYLAEIFGMSSWFFSLLLKLSWPLVSSLLSCLFLLFLYPSLDFFRVGGFCHLFCSGWLRMRKCQWSLCMELLREIKERGYDSVTKTFLSASVSYIWLPLSVCVYQRNGLLYIHQSLTVTNFHITRIAELVYGIITVHIDSTLIQNFCCS